MSAGPSSTTPSSPSPQDRWTRLVPGPANRVPLTPVGFLQRSAEIFPDRLAVVHGSQRIRYAQLFERACRLASALQRRGVQPGDVVAVMLPNVPAMIDAHFGVPMAGAVLCVLSASASAHCSTNTKVPSASCSE